MLDRVPANPGRVLITPESGSPYYATVTRADNPTQEGTPLNKASLLSDATAALLGGDSTMVPDEAFQALKSLIDDVTTLSNSKAQIATGSYTGTGEKTVSITFPFTPKVVFVHDSGAHAPIVFIYGVTKEIGVKYYEYFWADTVTWSSNGLSWRGTASTCANTSGLRYRYVAIG